jgi:hypothetical protein
MSVINHIVKLLTFKLKRNEMLEFNNKHLLAGIIGTWIVGIGRYWDDSKASTLQHLGLGSVIYIFALAAFIWLIILPFKIEKWSYKTVLIFIALTSFPAVFYAIPVERFFSISTANTMNVWFLAIVALWRLCLLYYFLKHFTKLSAGNIMTVTFMPICLIISVLTLLNLHNVVFEVMGGIRNPSPHDGSYIVLMWLTGLSMLFAIPLIVAYIIGISDSIRKK